MVVGLGAGVGLGDVVKVGDGDTDGDGVTLGPGVGDGVVDGEGGRMASLRSLTRSSSRVTRWASSLSDRAPSADVTRRGDALRRSGFGLPNTAPSSAATRGSIRAIRRPSLPTVTAMCDDLERVS